MDFHGERVLVFGDSLSASPSSPGGVLGDLLRRDGAVVKIDAFSGRSAYNFFSTREPYAAKLASDRNFKPTIVIVFLGTNDVASGVGATKDEPFMRQIHDAFPGAQKIAIGPPAFTTPRADLNTKSQPIVDMMSRVFGSGFVDARPLTPVGGRTDGVHFSSTGAVAFAGAIHGHLTKKSGGLAAHGGPNIGSWAILGVLLLGFAWWRLR
jgi:lysophospholipase L1-like esterase